LLSLAVDPRGHAELRAALRGPLLLIWPRLMRVTAACLAANLADVSLLERLFPHHLRDVHAPTRLIVRGTLASASTAASPFTPVHAVVLRYELVLRRIGPYRRTDGPNEDPYDYTVAYTSPLLAEPAILVETPDGLVSVPTLTLEVRFASQGRPEPLVGAVPAELAAQVARVEAAAKDEVCYREQFLLQGDPIELEACIRPDAGGGGGTGPYRAGVGAGYVVCEAHPKLVELRGDVV